MEIYDYEVQYVGTNEFLKDWLTTGKCYLVENGYVIVDSQYDGQNENRFSLDEFLKRWAGEWNIVKVKINGEWFYGENSL